MQTVEDDDESTTGNELENSSSIKRLYVTNLELYPVKLTVSFITSCTSSAVGRPRYIIRTLDAILGFLLARRAKSGKGSRTQCIEAFTLTSAERSKVVREGSSRQGSGEERLNLASTYCRGR